MANVWHRNSVNVSPATVVPSVMWRVHPSVGAKTVRCDVTATTRRVIHFQANVGVDPAMSVPSVAKPVRLANLDLTA